MLACRPPSWCLNPAQREGRALWQTHSSRPWQHPPSRQTAATHSVFPGHSTQHRCAPTFWSLTSSGSYFQAHWPVPGNFQPPQHEALIFFVFLLYFERERPAHPGTSISNKRGPYKPPMSPPLQPSLRGYKHAVPFKHFLPCCAVPQSAHIALTFAVTHCLPPPADPALGPGVM